MKRFYCLFMVLLLALPVSVKAESADYDAAMKIETAASALVREGKAKGAILSVVKNGKEIVCRGFGYADEYNGIAADPKTTAFRIGSVSKTFVAVAAMVAVQEGKVDLDKDIAQYLGADCPKLSYPVTMKQLLTHTAGFEDMVTGMAVKNVSDTEPLSLTVHKYLPKQVFRPGEISSYSNYGIALAAYVVEKAMDQDFLDFCRERVFLPLNMNHTTFAYMHDTAFVSKPYLPDGRETLEPYMNLYPEGSAVSTAADMAIYMTWLMDLSDARVLSSTSKETLFARHFSMAEDLTGLCLGFNRKERNGHVYYDKKGETLHFYSRIALYPDKGMGVFLSYNTYLPEEEINAVMGKALDLIYGEDRTEAISEHGFDIAGLYVNNWSSFTTPEKLLRYIIPGKMISIVKSPESGYTLSGIPIIPIGENLYRTPVGKSKFMKQNGTVILATETAVTYQKVAPWQQPILLFIVPVAFLLAALCVFLREGVCYMRKSRRGNLLLLTLSGVQLFFMGVLLYLLYIGIMTFSLLSYIWLFKLCGFSILIAAVAGAVHVEHTRIKRRLFLMLPTIWSLTGILFTAWMGWMNLI